MRVRADLTTRPVGELILRMAIPSSVGFFFNTMFNVTDTWFAGLISTQAQAALSLSFPVFFLVTAFAHGLAAGTTALIGNAIGSRDHARAGRYAVQSVAAGFVLALLLTLAGLALSPWLFGLLGASGDYLRTSTAYMNVIFAGSVFLVLDFLFNSVLNAVGDTRSFRNYLFAASLANVFLDWWFVRGGFGLPALGVRGIALATILTQGLGCFYLAHKAARTGLLSVTSLADILPDRDILRELRIQSVPSALNNVTVGLGIFVITYFVALFGKSAVAAYGVAVRIEQIVLMPSIGLNVAVLALTAQNYGAGLAGRVREAVSKARGYGCAILILGGVVLFATPAPLMRLFTSDPEVIAAGTTYLRLAAFTECAYVLLYTSVSALQGLKRPAFAVWIGIFRQLAAPVVVFGLLTRLTTLGLLGLWWGILGITWTAAFISVRYLSRVLNEVCPPDQGVCHGGDPEEPEA